MTPSKNSVIVLGGSFNPPTRAHAALLTHALDATGAGTGVLVPSSDAYVRRKAAKHPGTLVFTEQERLDMLMGVTAADRRIEIRTFEFGDDGRGYTYGTMRKAREAYPGRDCWFLLGADKLRIVPRWHSSLDFLQEFGFVVLSRDGLDVDRIIASNSRLKKFRDRFAEIPALPGMSDTSSSRFQEMLRNGDPGAADLVSPEVYETAKAVLASGRQPS